MGNYNFDLDLKSDNTMSVINSWIKEEAEILEFGCANGRLTKYLAQNKRCHMTIVEIDSDSGKTAAQYAEHAFLGKEEGDINNFFWLSLPKKYDYIIFADVLEHLSNPQLVLDKCKEAIKDQGEILISIPNISHNSILIDLFNDKFSYCETGLLDKTHIHFFTYHSFCQMISYLDLKIIQQHAVYSRVGWNEINNSYSDVPFGIEKELRHRTSGSIYQYVFSVGKKRNFSEECKSEIQKLEEDSVRQEEASCYVWKDTQTSDTPERISYVYAPLENNVICFSVKSIVKRMRLDLIESAALIQIQYIKIKETNRREKETGVEQHNASFQFGNLFYFKETDPYLYIDLNGFANVLVDYVKIAFRLLDYRMSSFQMNAYMHIWEEINKKSKSIYVAPNEELEKSKNYINHLENDLNVVETDFCMYRKKKEAEISGLKEYIAHLENDLRVVETDFCMYRGKLQTEMSETKEYVTHLEKDLTVLKTEFLIYREKKEEEISEAREYIVHLENDIKILKSALSEKDQQI